MRFVDTLVRRGHLSEEAIVRALVENDRPVHLDRCETCASRATAIGRWLDELTLAGQTATDGIFTAERRQTQQAQILRRLEQLDAPSRVLSFPSITAVTGTLDGARRRVAPAWVGVAAAAGVLVGVIGGQLPHWMSPDVIAPTEATTAEPVAAPGEDDAANALAANSAEMAAEWEAAFAWGDRDFFRPQVESLEPFDALTPSAQDLVLNTTR